MGQDAVAKWPQNTSSSNKIEVSYFLIYHIWKEIAVFQELTKWSPLSLTCSFAIIKGKGSQIFWSQDTFTLKNYWGPQRNLFMWEVSIDIDYIQKYKKYLLTFVH